MVMLVSLGSRPHGLAVAQKVGVIVLGTLKSDSKDLILSLLVLSVPINTFISCQLSDKLMPFIPSSIALEKYRICTFFFIQQLFCSPAIFQVLGMQR